MSDSKRYYVFCKHSSARPAPDRQRLSHHSNLSLTLRQENEREIAPVSQRLALAPDRFYLWLTIDFERLAIPIQLTEREARSLPPEVAEVRDLSQALNIVERVLPPTMEGAS